MTHKESQILEEKDALRPLLNELQINCVEHSDEPDARISYEGKLIGIEVVSYHKSEAVMKAYSAFKKSLKKYEGLINDKGLRGHQITVMVEPEQVIHYSKSDEDILFKELNESIKKGYGVYKFFLFADADPILPPDAKCEVHCGDIGIINPLNIDKLKEIIAKKDLKIQHYKGLSSNSSIDEYWLVIYVNREEYNHFKGLQMPTINSDYSRIYLTHPYDGALQIKPR